VAWETGWIRFVDRDGDYRAGRDEALLGVTPALQGLRIRTRDFERAFAYAPSGRVSGPDGVQGGGEFTFCTGDNPGDTQVLHVTPLGQPLLAQQLADRPDSDCSVG
jgi:hypothetical protein